MEENAPRCLFPFPLAPFFLGLLRTRSSSSSSLTFACSSSVSATAAAAAEDPIEASDALALIFSTKIGVSSISSCSTSSAGSVAERTRRSRWFGS